ncbi:LysR family transcriptional regulator [Epibacterium sp. SM1979]|uniref:LysR family transcriptional regulator n=1 Tax=Tritonibacter litoralis TaxID=2662264 RepID=A0A843YGA9_9RHOB|nr:LysR family transcriptional regulator [Tritonibacter litoralis]MQQ07827.1 LysR family transcriptional regulator [Tritonibacter litoralis]
MKPRFRQLEAFHAIMVSGTVTGAAEKLGISQPGISNLLSQLEASSEIKLFERHNGRLIPTPEADILFQEVDTLMRGLERTSQTLMDLQSNRLGQLQVASQHSLSFGFMPRLISRFATDRPDVTVSFQAQYSGKIQEWVAAGLFEIGVCEAPLYHDNLNAELFQFETFLALHKAHPLAEYTVLTPEMLRGVPFVVMSPQHPTQRRLRQAFDDAGVPINARVHSHLFKNLLSFVKQGMGVALVDCFVSDYDDETDVVLRRFDPKVPMEMAVVTSKSRQMSRVGHDFMDLLLAALHLKANNPLNRA